jgi:hypothetical protein
MGEVAAASFTTHVPRLMIKDPAARKAYVAIFFIHPDEPELMEILSWVRAPATIS